MDAKITAAGFDDGTGSISSRHGGPNPGERALSGLGGSSVLNRRPMDRRPSLGDSSLHTLNLAGEGLSESSGDSEGGMSDGSSEASSSTSAEKEEVKKVQRKGGWMGGWMGQSGKSKKNFGSSSTSRRISESEYESNSSRSLSSDQGGRHMHRQSSLSSVARRTSSGVDETDDLVRPYHRAFHTKERPSFLRRSPMGSVRIMGSDEMYHDAKSKGSSSTAAGAEKSLSSASGGKSSSSSSDMNLSKFSSSYQKNMGATKGSGEDGSEFDLSVSKTQRRRRFLPVLTVSLLVLSALAVSAYLLLFSADGDRRAALRSSAQSFFSRSRETAESMPLPLSSTSTDLENCILNAHFADQPATSHWYGVRSDITAAAQYDHALLASDRTNARLGGMWQNINSKCLQPDTWYEVEANVLLRNAGTEETVDCDPSIPWFTHEQSCPSIALKIDDHVIQDIAWTIGPLSMDPNGWYRLYGAFRPSEEMLQKSQIAVIIARAPTNVDIVVDQVQINPANKYTVGVISDCAAPDVNLIANGNAETGDHRYWWIRGNGGDSGHIEVPNTKSERGFVFKHAGYRAERWRGMLQNLVDTSCLTPGSTWRISALFRYYKTTVQGTEEPQVCDRTNQLVENSCPVFEIQFFSPQDDSNTATINTGPLTNEDVDTEFVLGGWNRIVHTITITEEMARSSHVWLYVQSVHSGFNYELDEIEMVPVY